jgi:acyl carrier protein
MATSPHDIAVTLETFIRGHFHVINDDPHFSRDAHLFEGGYVDSAGIVELLMFVEDRFATKLHDEEIFSDQFTTINGIASLLASHEPRLREVDATLS